MSDDDDRPTARGESIPSSVDAEAPASDLTGVLPVCERCGERRASPRVAADPEIPDLCRSCSIEVLEELGDAINDAIRPALEELSSVLRDVGVALQGLGDSLELDDQGDRGAE